MSKREFLKQHTSREISELIALFRLKNEEAEDRSKKQQQERATQDRLNKVKGGGRRRAVRRGRR